MSSLAAIAVLAAGIVLVISGAELFFRGLLEASSRLRLPPFVLTVVVSGFEVENLAAGIAANANGLPNAAAGTFLGGTTFLALAVAGLAALAAPLAVTIPRAALAWTAVAPVPLAIVSLDGVVSRLDGLLLVGWFVAAILAVSRSGMGLPRAPARTQRRLVIGRMAGGLALLTAGGELLGEGVRRVVGRLGVSESLLGNTVVAASVEAEEVARVAVPARHGRADVALGNLLGTIVHFVALNAGVIALVRPLELDSVSRFLHLPAATAAPFVLCALAAARGGLGRADGALLLGLYAAYVAAAVVHAVV